MQGREGGGKFRSSSPLPDVGFHSVQVRNNRAWGGTVEMGRGETNVLVVVIQVAVSMATTRTLTKRVQKVVWQSCLSNALKDQVRLETTPFCSRRY